MVKSIIPFAHRTSAPQAEVQFRALAAEWRLSVMEAALLLGVDGLELGLDLVPLRSGPAVLERMRMLARLRRPLSRLFDGYDDLNRWLRLRDPDDVVPIVFMSYGIDHVAAVVVAVERALARQSS